MKSKTKKSDLPSNGPDNINETTKIKIHSIVDKDSVKYFKDFDLPTNQLIPVSEKNKFEIWVFQNGWIILMILLLIMGASIYSCQLFPPVSEIRIVFLEYFGRPISVHVDYNLVQFNKFYLPIIVVLILEGYFIVDFSRMAGNVFVELERYGYLATNPDFSITKRGRKSLLKPESAESFAMNLRDALTSPWRYCFVIVFGALFLYFLLNYDQIWAIVYLIRTGYVPIIIFNLVELVLMPLVVTYLAGLSLWLFIVVSSFVSSLAQLFTIRIDPEHPDKSGGLKRLGDLSLRMALMTILPSVAISIWHLNGFLNDHMWQPFREIQLLAILTMLLVSILVFFLPILGIHREMVSNADRYQDESMRAINFVHKEILNVLAGPGSSDDKLLTALEKKLDLIKKIHNPEHKMPLWPFDTSILLKFVVPQALPILTLFAELGDSQKNIVQKLFDVIGSWLGG